MIKYFAIALLAFAGTANAADYVQTTGSTLAFATKYQGETFTGKFNTFNTKLSLDPKNLVTAKLNVSINMLSATTNDKERDGYLSGVDFFDPKKFATATFASNNIKQTAPNQYVANGTLTIKGISKPSTFTFTTTTNAAGMQLSGKAIVKRLDYGVGGSSDWKDTSVIPNEVAVSTRVNLKKVP